MSFNVFTVFVLLLLSNQNNMTMTSSNVDLINMVRGDDMTGFSNGIANGANINQVDGVWKYIYIINNFSVCLFSFTFPVLHFTVDRPEMFKMLVERGADLNTKNNVCITSDVEYILSETNVVESEMLLWISDAFLHNLSNVFTC